MYIRRVRTRAMSQRRKGRDLFDLYWALTPRSALPVSIDAVVDGFFRHDMNDEEIDAPRAGGGLIGGRPINVSFNIQRRNFSILCDAL